MKHSLQGAGLLAGLLLTTSSFEALAQDDDDRQWFMSMDIQGLLGSYDDSSTRDSLDNVGIFVHADRFERVGFTFGYNRTMLGFTDSGEDLEQDTLFVSGRLGLTPDWLGGRLTLRLDAYDVSSDAADSQREPGTVSMGQISYLNYARSFYWDVGLAGSDYSGTSAQGGRLELDQLTPSIGFSANRQRDWIQLRAWLIDVSAAGNAALPGDTSAIELKWTHWLPADGFLGLETLRFSALAGERLLAIDPDAATIYNLSDLQTGGFSLGGEWAVGDNSSLLLIVGIEDYEDTELSEAYTSSFLYLNFSHEWD